MRSLSSAWTGSVLLALAINGAVQAQSPIGKEFTLYQGPDGVYGPDVAFFPDGRFLIGYQTIDANGDDGLWVNRYSPLGAPLGPPVQVHPGVIDHLTDAAGIRLVPAGDGGFWTLWYEQRAVRSGPSARRYSAAGEPLAGPFPLQEDPRFFPISGLEVQEDRLVVLGRTYGETGYWPAVAEFDGSGGALLRETAADRPYQPFSNPLALFLESSGDLRVAWQTVPREDGTGGGVWAHRFSREGSPLDSPVPLNRRSQPGWAEPRVARDGAGNLIAVWQAKDKEGPYEDIYAQRISATGERSGIFVVNSVRESAQRFPTVAADRAGDFVVFWQSFDPAEGNAGWHLRGQLFRKDGRRMGQEIVIPNPGGDNDTWEPGVTFGPNGTFLLHYVATGPVLVRRYAASPGDEPCVWRGSTVACDTGRTGGEAELPLPPRLFPGDVPLLGDVDGDGRADPCVRRGRRFLCDTAHDGTWGWRVTFGESGETPLLGDVDGDGRAEACARSGRQLRCDTAHDGGRAEWTESFGEPEDLPLLGDVDGDGRDDLCVFRAGRFLCDTAHDGGAPEWAVTFGQPGDLPLLGDFDGDGRDDPCVFRAGQFLCDTAHDGGAPEARLSFGRPGDRPLLGNLDGL